MMSVPPNSSVTAGVADRRGILWPVLLAFVAWGVWLSYYEYRFDLNVPPDPSGDEVDYDSLGWELSQGNGFQVDTSDPEFRRPYEVAAQSAERFRLAEGHQGTLTSRPPLFPLVIAATDLVCGRQFWAVRLFNSGCLAVSLGLLLWLLQKQRGSGPMVLAFLLFLVVDQRTRLFGRAILTEAVSVLLVTVLFLLLLRQMQQYRTGNLVLLGVVFGLAVLARSLFILWLPGMILIVAGCTIGNAAWRTSSQRYGRGLRDGGLFAATALLVLAPWMVRNCLVLEEFMPLGTQGAGQMAAAFGETVWEERGQWINLQARGYFDAVLRDDMTILEQEKATAHYSLAQAKSWILEHPGQALLLVPLKIGLEHWPRTWGETLVLLLAVPGCLLTCRETATRIGLAFLLVNAVAIGMTWSVEGRFVVPVLILLHYWAALGSWAIVQRFGMLFQRPATAAA